MLQTIDFETVKWLIGGLITIIGILVSILWGVFTSDIKKSRYFRHHTVPALLAEVHSEIITIRSVTANHEWRISAHDVRLDKLESK